MIIREANRFDIPEILDLLRNYRDATPWSRVAKCDDADYVTKIITFILSGGGIIFIAEDETKLFGMLMAIRNSNAWDPTLIQLDEMCYWVEPEHRGTSAGYRLIKEYVKYAQELKDKGGIEAYTISKMVNSPDLKYDKFGFEKLEEKWIRQ